ncbi:hypothetical protein, partial [Mesorhizobium sp. M7A.F.Ca.US.002.01.1.1]|uniref:hypothetical protein n=1 Tax=Mesorhizobium sp. M7A.F.Ca.US.002.01.1.1 TaxID=2496700 RepID=UPI0019D49C57
ICSAADSALAVWSERVALSCSAIRRIAIDDIPDFRLRGSLKSGQAESKTVGFENRSGAYFCT